VAETKTLEDMQAEVAAFCASAGWRDGELPFPAAMAGLHEAIARIAAAWREWDMADGTAGVTPERPEGSWHAVPRGVAAEYSAVLFVLLDIADRYQLPLLAAYRALQGEYGYHDHYLANVNVLHSLACYAAETRALGGETAEELAGVLSFLVQLARRDGISLNFEYERRLRYLRRRLGGGHSGQVPW
jgi:hypothetical protein